MPEQWSQRIADHFQAHLPPDLAEWLDRRIGDDAGEPYLGSFTGVVIDPAGWLDSSSSAVWGGLMLPDTLPILNNGCGDVLAVRFGRDGGVSEVIRWDHEGGWWRPFGKTLAEAILCDIATTKAERPEHWTREPRGVRRPIEEWAVDWVRRTTAPALKWPDPFDGDNRSVTRVLLDAGICEVVARQVFCEAYLTSELRIKVQEIGGDLIAEKLGVDWSVVRDWLRDSSRIPEGSLEPLSSALGLAGLTADQMREDWDRATVEAQRVTELRPELAWPYAILGQAAERNDDPARAAEYYGASLRRPKTTCSFMTIEPSFVLERLGQLRNHVPDNALTDPYLQAALQTRTPHTFPFSIRRYWLREAEAAEQRGHHDRAYECYYNAGWDDLVFDDMPRVLEGLLRSAEAAGFTTLARVAAHHLASLNAMETRVIESARRKGLTARLHSWVARLWGNR